MQIVVQVDTIADPLDSIKARDLERGFQQIAVFGIVVRQENPGHIIHASHLLLRDRCRANEVESP
jgi:hypothetical protein